MLFRSLPYKTKQFFLVLIKLSIVIGAIYFIHEKLTNNEELEFSVFVDFLSKNDSFSLKNVIFLIILSIFNWFFEILKWKKLVSSITKISFKNAMEQSLGALTGSILTPNRIGEYGAKAVYYVSGFRKKIVFLNLIGNVMQMMVTTLFGLTGLILLDSKYEVPLDYYKVFKVLVVIVMIGVFTLFGLKRSKVNVKGFSLNAVLNFFKAVSKEILILALSLSLLRYLIFSFQFYVLLILFGVEVSYYNAMIVITSLYLMSSIIPTIFIFDVVVKGSIAVYLFSIVGVNDFTTLSIVLIMWILNFMIPSIFGSYYVLNFNLPKPD